MKDKILKYISGEATDYEKQVVLDWIEEDEKHMRYFSQLKNNWVADNISELEKREAKEDKRRSVFTSHLALAAMIILLIFLSIALFLEINNRSIFEQKEAIYAYNVNPGVKGLVELPDGSRVWLNSSSSLKMPQQFSESSRDLELEGEGYFEIITNPEWPMYIKTSKGYTVRVTGTSFNLSSYSDDDKLIITLVSGAVSLISPNDNDIIDLEPDQELIVMDMKKVLENIKEADIVANTAWKSGVLVFNNTPMIDVIRKLRRWYGVEISVTNPEIFENYFTAKFSSESITQVLEILRLSSDIQSTIEENSITLYKRK